MAEGRPRCTVCGLRVVRAGGLLHYDDGATFGWAGRPVGHHAVVDPRFLVLWLRFAAAWEPARVVGADR